MQIILICSIANHGMSAWLLRRVISLHALIPFLAGGAIGVPTDV